MEIYPFDKSFDDNFTIDDVSKVQADGISIRIGNRIVKLQVTEETVIDDVETVRKELEEKFSEYVNNVKSQFENYKEQMRTVLMKEKEKISQKEKELARRISEVSTLPNLTFDHMRIGLSVSKNNHGLVWSYKAVYAPKFVSDRRIDPTFAKRLVTPICIEVYTDGAGLVYDCKVKQILGDKKFQHYHSLGGNSDCWGNFKPNGRTITEPNDMIAFCREAVAVLETINDMSIGTMNPRGLPRYNTLKKNLLSVEESGKNPNDSRSSTNSRNERSGVSQTMENESESVWST
jgi:hypothetical protein